MRVIALLIALAIFLASGCQLKAQYDDTVSTYKRWFVGTSLFVFLGNLETENPPNFVQLNLGYRLSGKDVLTLAAKTWKYAWPNGIHPFLNSAYKKAEEKFPGYIREYGISVSYTRFLWEGLFADLNELDGFQMFNSYRIGYHIVNDNRPGTRLPSADKWSNSDVQHLTESAMRTASSQAGV
ncbi:MAG: hypothetical protein IPH49_07845 [Ignavibacteria bacterium]|nr:hypothetical protein [Ignavibacteria bacterium]